MKPIEPLLLDDTISLKTANGIEILHSSDIIYCCIKNREVVIVLLNGQTKRVLHSLTELEGIFTPFHFYRCHAKNLINIAHIKLYNHKMSTLRLSNDIELNVASDRKVKFKQMIYRKILPT